MCLYYQEWDRMEEGRRWAKRRTNMTLKRRERIERRIRQEDGCKEQRNAGGRANETKWKWMTNDEGVRRRQRGGGGLPVNQIRNQSFDRGLLWPETCRLTFAPTHIHTFTDALNIVSTQLHGDKCVSLASSLVLSACNRAYQHSCTMLCVYMCVSECK